MRRKSYTTKKYMQPGRKGPYRVYSRVDLSNPNQTILEILFNTENKDEGVYLKISLKKHKGKYIHGKREKNTSVYQANVECEDVGQLTEDQLAAIIKGDK